MPNGADRRGYLAVIGGMSVHLMIGAFYLWGSIGTYVVSYFRKRANPTLTYDEANLIFPVSTCMNCMFTSVGLYASSRFGSRKATLLFCTINILAVFLSSLVDNFWSFFMLYGVLQGSASGCLYLTPIRIATRYFPYKKGTASGLIVAAYAMASFLLAFMVVPMINPLNERPYKAAD